MIGYDGKTLSGESCRVFIASIWECGLGFVNSYHLFASVTGNKEDKVVKGKDGNLQSINISKTDYALARSTEDKRSTLNTLYEAGFTLPDSEEKWVCKDFQKIETQNNPFENNQRRNK